MPETGFSRANTYKKKAKLTAAAEMAQLFGTPRITSMFKPIGERCATAPPLSGEAASKSRGQDVDVESDEDSDDADYQPPAKIGLPRDMRNMNDDQGH